MLKNPPADAGDTRNVGVISGLGRSLGYEMATHSSVLAWRTSWTEEPGGLQSMGSPSQTGLNTHTHMIHHRILNIVPCALQEDLILPL